MVVVGAAAAFGIIQVDSPVWAKTGLQIVIGSFLGYNVDRTAVARIRSMIKPIALSTVWLISSSLLIGYLLAQLSGIDLATAFFATTPGGLAEMTAMAMSSHANVALVATLQSFRIVATVLTIPALSKGVVPPRKPAVAQPMVPAEPSSLPTLPASRLYYSWLVWLVLGTLGSGLFLWAQVPAAGVIGSMVAVAIARIIGVDTERPPLSLRTLAQVGLGILIGLTFDDHTVELLRDEFPLVMLVTAGTVISGLGLAGVVERALMTDRQTALLACAPGGLAQMGIIADELGAQVFVVNVFQLARLITAVLILPLVIHFLL